ncbi:MAG: acyl-CoA carboxylase subunit epsilon [Dermatophilaceae bacterium]
MSDPTSPDVPTIRIEHGNPTPEEVGVIVAVLSAASGGGDGDGGAPDRRSHWAAPGERLAGPAPGRGGWRWSGMPR